MISPKDHIPKKPSPKMWDEEGHSVKAKSMANERRLSRALDFELTPGSGNTEWVSKKGDGSTPEFMIECKETQKDSISVGTAVIAKLCREAAEAGKEPVLILSAYGIPEPLPKEWVAFPLSIFR